MIAILTALGGAIGGVWRDMSQRLAGQAKEIQELRQENVALHAENAEIKALYTALYFELYGQEPDEREGNTDRPTLTANRRRRITDRRKPSQKEESDG